MGWSGVWSDDEACERSPGKTPTRSASDVEPLKDAVIVAFVASPTSSFASRLNGLPPTLISELRLAVTFGLAPPPNSASTASSAVVMSSHWMLNGCCQSLIAAEKPTLEPAADVAKDASTVVSNPPPRSTCAPVENVAFTLPAAEENPSFVGSVNETQLGRTVPPVAAGSVAVSDRPAKFAV